MSDSPDELERRQAARRHMARLKDMLAGKAPAIQEGPAEPSAPPPPPRPRGGGGAASPQNRLSSPPADTTAATAQAPPPVTAGQLTAIGECLRRPRQGRLADLLAQAQQLNRLNQMLRAYLPPPLHEHASLVRLDPDAWVVQTDSPAWAVRLRYQLPQLRQPLSDRLGIAVPPPQIRIVPEAAPYTPPPRRMIITEQAAQTLEAAAREFSDPHLSAAVLRLAEHARQRNHQS